MEKLLAKTDGCRFLRWQECLGGEYVYGHMILLKIIKHIIIIIAISFVVWAVFAILFGLPTIGLLYLFNFDIQNLLFWGFIAAILFASYWYQKAKDYQRELEYYKGNEKKQQSK